MPILSKLQMFWSWSEDMHVVIILKLFLSLFLQVELGHFSGIITCTINGTLRGQLLQFLLLLDEFLFI